MNKKLVTCTDKEERYIHSCDYKSHKIFTVGSEPKVWCKLRIDSDSNQKFSNCNSQNSKMRTIDGGFSVRAFEYNHCCQTV